MAADSREQGTPAPSQPMTHSKPTRSRPTRMDTSVGSALPSLPETSEKSSTTGSCSDPPRISDVSAPDSVIHPTASYDTDIEAMVPGRGGGGPNDPSGRNGSSGPWWFGNHRNHYRNQRKAYPPKKPWFSGAKSTHHHSPSRSFGVTAEVWPGQRHWKMKAQQQKMQRSCTGLSRLSKRKRMAAKILIGLLVVGVAVGVGLGISKALGAPMWSPHDYRNLS